jgi:hypothetical protein
MAVKREEEGLESGRYQNINDNGEITEWNVTILLSMVEKEWKRKKFDLRSQSEPGNDTKEQPEAFLVPSVKSQLSQQWWGYVRPLHSQEKIK